MAQEGEEGVRKKVAKDVLPRYGQSMGLGEVWGEGLHQTQPG